MRVAGGGAGPNITSVAPFSSRALERELGSPFPVRSSQALFDLAVTASRLGPCVDNGRLGARGYGFAIGNSLESSLYRSGGAGLANPSLALRRDPYTTLARVITVCDGWLHVGDYDDELFDVCLFVVSPDGGQDICSFYAGPSGLAVGEGYQLRHPLHVDACDEWSSRRELQRVGTEVADALIEALESVEPASLSRSVKSDLGEHRAADEVTRHRLPLESRTVERVLDDVQRRVSSSVHGNEAMQHVSTLYSVLNHQSEEADEAHAGWARELAGAIWPPAMEFALQAYDRLADESFLFPDELDRVAPILPYPPVALPGLETKQEALREGWEAALGRRFRTHPFQR